MSCDSERVLSCSNKVEFRKCWVDCLHSIDALYSKLLPVEEQGNKIDELRGLKPESSVNDIEKALRRVWDFDGRFFGEVLGFDYEWSVYSLCYLCRDEEIIHHTLNVYIPLLGGYIQEKLGANFHAKVGRTFMGNVEHILWEEQGLTEPEDHALFDWHGNRNNLSVEDISNHLRITGLPVLKDPNFPPSEVMLRFTNLQPFNSEKEYLLDLQTFYCEKGYSITEQ